MQIRTLITAEEFENLCSGLGPAELVRGEIVRLPPAGFQHSQVVARIVFELGSWARRTGHGRVLAGEAGVIVKSDPDTVRGADVAYISYNRLPRREEPKGFFSTPPELVVEVVGLGQGWREMIDKAGEYLAMGVDRVWIVDPKQARLHSFRPDLEPQYLSVDDAIVDDAILPGFSCVVRQFFED